MCRHNYEALKNDWRGRNMFLPFTPQKVEQMWLYSNKNLYLCSRKDNYLE